MQTHSKAIILLIVSLLVLAQYGCNDSPGSSVVESEEPGFFEPSTFVDDTERAGIGSFRHSHGGFGEKWFPEIMGSGGGFIDFDNDGWQDILLVGGGALPSRPASSETALSLYRNQGNGSFVDATEASGLSQYQAYGMGVVAADYDNDGDADLFLTNLGRNFLFNNDQGVYREVGMEAGIADRDAWSTSALFFDANRDGLLDLYVANYVEWSPETDVACEQNGLRDYCNPLHYPAVSDDFYLNNGDGTFRNATDRSGFLGGGEMGSGKGLGVIELDVNRDNWPDIYVANDGDRNFLFMNRGDGTFTETAERSGVAFDRRGAPQAGMGVDAGVVDSTGEVTVFVGNFSQESMSVWRHQRDGFFVDRATVSGLGFPTRRTLTFGLVLFDADLDTDLDVMVANGNVIEQIASIQDGVTFRQRPQLFLNRGDGIFDELVDETSPLAQELLARGLAAGDVDRDGDLDVLLTENNGPAHLWKNEFPEKAYLRVHLRGTESNRDGIGARVQATLNDLTLERDVRAGSSYGSTSEKIITFGLGDAAGVERLEIHWPGGTVDRFEDVSANQEILIVEGSGEITRIHPPPG